MGIKHIFRTSPLNAFIHIHSTPGMTSTTWHMHILSGRIDDMGWFQRLEWLLYGDDTGAVFMEPRPVQFNGSKTHRGRRCK